MSRGLGDVYKRQKHGSETLVNPDPKMVLNLGDEMIIIGEHSNIKALEEVV